MLWDVDSSLSISSIFPGNYEAFASELRGKYDFVEVVKLMLMQYRRFSKSSWQHVPSVAGSNFQPLTIVLSVTIQLNDSMKSA